MIRYLYLADTFEERLLLHLISKYEKARACLSFMPDTLGGVAAPPGSLHEPLIAGFAERGPSLFGAPLVQTLDLAAEDERSDAYRDLLREIDRAFQSFDRMAVRHGWLSGGEAADAPETPVGAAIDLPVFVASVLEAVEAEFRVPESWRGELDGLSGFDATRGTVRLAFESAQDRDGQERPLLYPGRAHPLTRRAIGAARMSPAGRVSAARAGEPGWLLIYAVEAGLQFRRVFGLHVSADGLILEEADVLAFTEDAAGSFPWPAKQVEAACKVAGTVAERLFGAHVADRAARFQRAADQALAWLERRALTLCAKPDAFTADLFGPVPDATPWRQPAEPEERLRGFATDASVPRERRQDAAEALRQFRAMLPPSTPLPRPMTRLIGVLCLCP
ncbi:MAG: hypothetical protein ACJ8AI_25175 [Rhodopila sp.]